MSLCATKTKIHQIMKKINNYTGLMCLLLIQSQMMLFAQESPKATVPRILTASQVKSSQHLHNKIIPKQLTAFKQTLKSNAHLSHTLLGKKFHYVAGKPIWVLPYDKYVNKPLSSINSDFKQENTFYKSLYQVQEVPFQADIEAKIFFLSGEHTLSSRNQVQFKNLLKVIYQTLQAHLQKDPRYALKINIEVAGFTDSKPFYAHQPQEERKKSNLVLSQKRAEQVAAYLLKDLSSEGVQISVKAEGFGEVLPSFGTQELMPDEQRRLCFVKVYFSPQKIVPTKYPLYDDLSTMPGR